MPAFVRLFCAFMFVLLLAAPAFADEKESAKTEAPAAEKPLTPEELAKMKAAAEEHKKAVMAAQEKLAALTKDLSAQERRHFQLAYFSYNMIKTVDLVRGDVTSAVKNCGEKNPDRKEKLDARLKAWNEKIDPIMTEANGHLDNMILAQEYAKKADIKSLFKSLDVARDKSMGQIERVPVSTPEACDYLLEKLDDTEERLTGLLRNTLVSPPAPEAELKKTEPPSETPPGQKAESADKKQNDGAAAKTDQ